VLVRRSWHDVTENRLKEGRCPQCDAAIPGVWERNARDLAHSAQHAEKYSHLNL
jgi:hypothetical protein